MTVRYAVVGCSGIGAAHADAVEAAAGADLVAVVDTDREAATAFAEERGLSAFTDVAAAVEDGDVDALSVCTPSGTHAEVTCEAAEAGAHVLCEKPLDVYEERIGRMIDACDEAGVTLAGVFQYRTYEASRIAKAAVEDGELGDLVLGDVTVKWYRSQEYYDSAEWRGTRAMDGGCLMNQAIHAIDRLDWLCGGIESVRARTDRLARDFECEDTAVLSLAFENGALGSVEATTATRGGRSATELNGTEGSLTLERDAITHFETADGPREVDAREVVSGEGHEVVVGDFVEALRTGRDPMVPGEEARRAVDVVLAAYESAERGGAEVPVDPAAR